MLSTGDQVGPSCRTLFGGGGGSLAMLTMSRMRSSTFEGPGQAQAVLAYLQAGGTNAAVGCLSL